MNDRPNRFAHVHVFVAAQSEQQFDVLFQYMIGQLTDDLHTHFSDRGVARVQQRLQDVFRRLACQPVVLQHQVPGKPLNLGQGMSQ